MKLSPWALARSVRYALPGIAGRIMPAPTGEWAARAGKRLERKGLAVSFGYFQGNNASKEDIAKANEALIRRMVADGPAKGCLSVKAPPLRFDPALIRGLAELARPAGIPLLLDAHGPEHAEQTLHLLDELLPDHPGTGCAIPARWHRSMDDAARFRDRTARIRLVKGEWPDPVWNDCDISANYLALVSCLAGRKATVTVATHDPSLAKEALDLLLESGTPCELEQLRGLPKRRTMAIARDQGVPVRVYLPLGPGWWPYAIDKAFARPYLPIWAVMDLLGIR